MRFQMKVYIRYAENDNRRRAEWKTGMETKDRECKQTTSDFLLRWECDTAVFVFQVGQSLTVQETRQWIIRALDLAGPGSVVASELGFEMFECEDGSPPSVIKEALPAGGVNTFNLDRFVMRSNSLMTIAVSGVARSLTSA